MSQPKRPTRVTGQGEGTPDQHDQQWPMDSAYWGNLPSTSYLGEGGGVGGLFDGGPPLAPRLLPDPT